MARGKEIAKREEKPMAAKYEDFFNGYSEEEIQELGQTTGLESKPPEERRPPIYLWNIDTIDDFGNEIDPGRFWNPQTGEQFDTVRCAFVGFREIRQRDHRDDSGNFIVDCRSFDKQTGTDSEGKTIACENCPYRFGKKGQRKDCTFHIRFMGFDLDRKDFFAFMAKRSSYIPTSRYLERNFFGQLADPRTGRRMDIPLYMMETVISLKAEIGAGRKYYVPAYMCTKPLPKETVLDLLPAANSFKKMNVQEEFEADDRDMRKASEQVNRDDPPPIGDDDIPF